MANEEATSSLAEINPNTSSLAEINPNPTTLAEINPLTTEINPLTTEINLTPLAEINHLTPAINPTTLAPPSTVAAMPPFPYPYQPPYYPHQPPTTIPQASPYPPNPEQPPHPYYPPYYPPYFPPAPSTPYKDPYFIGSGDLPGLLITHVVLRKDNYAEWARAVRMALLSRRKLSFLEGTEPKPIDDPALLFDWQCMQALLVSWVLNTIDPVIRSQVSFFEEIFPLWDTLRQRYEADHGSRKQQLKNELAGCMQSPSMSVEEYLGKLQPLWTEYNHLYPLAVCNCGNCTCGTTQKAIATRRGDQFQDFMYGLNRELYSALRSSLLSQDPLPTLDKAYNKVREEESSRLSQMKPVEEFSALALRATVRTPSSRIDRSRLVCTHCLKQGHDVDSCFVKHGVPVWYDERQQQRALARGSQAAQVRVQAPSARRFPAASVQPHQRLVNPSRHPAARDGTAAGNATLNSVAALPAEEAPRSFTREQYDQLLGLLSNSGSDRMMGPQYQDNDWIR